MTAYGDLLWEPSPARISAAALTAFAARASAVSGRDLSRFSDLYQWSVTDLGPFWQAVADHAGLVFQRPATAAYEPPPPGLMRGARWFAGARLNYAENLLAGADRPDAVVALAEGGGRRVWSLGTLRADVARCAAALRRAGVGPGDRVAGVIANVPEALIAMLATASLGGVWASCSPDFGAAAVVDRLGQIAPKVIFFTSSYVYNGKRFDCAASAAGTLAKMSSPPLAVQVPHLGDAPRGTTWAAFLGTGPAPELAFTPRAFDDPLFIMFSSGTTGVPKCIVHGIGGTLIQHAKELLLHSDVGPGARLLFYTTCGWMMWNWMVTALATRASLVLYEGAVMSPDLGALWRTVRGERVTHFGTSPKFIASCMGAGLDAKTALGGWQPRALLCTGSPLLPEHADWIYRQAGPDLHLASISGGTDIVSCFMLGVPTLPVRAGEIQHAGLGMAVAAWDDAGHPVRGAKAELVCTRPFPSMPLGFFGDTTGERYRQAYFAYYSKPAYAGPEVWRHGDYVEMTAAGGVIVYGRSDATLNPGGVRIGTAELYRQVEAIPEVQDSLAIGRRDPGGDEHIVLFVKLTSGRTLDPALTQRIKDAIRRGLTPRHVPKDVYAVRDIPYTRSGKKVELAVTQAIHGEPVPNLAAIANPESMDEYFAMARR